MRRWRRENNRSEEEEEGEEEEGIITLRRENIRIVVEGNKKLRRETW